MDIAGFIVFTAAMLVLLAAIAAAGDAALRGVDIFKADLMVLADPGLAASRLSQDAIIFIGFVLGSIVYGAIVAAVFLIARLRGGRGWRAYIAWRAFTPDRSYWLVALMGVIWGVGVGSLIEYLYPESKSWVTFPKGFIGGLVSFGLVVGLGPLCEEALFRGWLYTRLRPRLGFLATLAISAILFALAHWEKSHLYAAAVFPVGVLLGHVRERSGSMKATFAFHGFYNLAGWILAMFASK
jgi:membrane protease YdiL (CAAX protease family)